MKKITAYIATLLLVSGATTFRAMAQADDEPAQDAMYVYRNDGKFHGFFNAEVLRVEFSKVDTLGREHIDYVTQEIETIDSLYRIPISAIDSVSFYTPRTEYVEDVRVTTKSEMWDYVVASDSMTWITLSASTPSNLMPKVGDKLCTTKSRKLLPGGFYGTVQKVSQTAAGTRLDCSNDGLTAYLKRHIFKGGVQVNEDERTLARRRMLALKKGTESSSVVRQTLDTIKYEFEMEGEYEINDNWKISGELSTKVAIAPTIYAAAFGAIGMREGMNMNCALHVNAKTIAEMVAKVKLEWSYDVPLSKRLIWITDTPFFVEIEPGVHFGMSGELELDHSEEVTITASASAAINKSLFTDREMVHTNAGLQERKSSSKAVGTFTCNFGPYFAVNLLLGTEDIGKIGLRVEAGAKMVISAEMEIGKDEEAPDKVSTKMYDRLNADGSLKIGPYGQVSCNWKFLEVVEDEATLWEYEPGWEFNGGLVPKFNNLNVNTYDPSTKMIDVSAKLDGNVLFFMGGPVGFALYDENSKEISRAFDTRNYFDPKLWNYYSLRFNDVEYDRWYTVHPVCHLMGYEIVASPAEKFYAGPRDLVIEPTDSLKFDYLGGTKFVSVKNTFSDKTSVGTGWMQDKWMTYEEVPGGYNVTVKPNETTKRRQIDMYFTASDPNSWFNSRQRTLVIYQDIDPRYLGLLMQSYNGYCLTDAEKPYIDVWTTSTNTDVYENGRADLWGAPIVIGEEDINDAFDRNSVIKKTDDGKFTLDGDGLVITGEFYPVADGGQYRSGSGTFTLTTDMQHHRKSKEDMEGKLRNGIAFLPGIDLAEALNPTLDEHFRRQVQGTVEVEWDDSKQMYRFIFKGNGTLTYDAECYTELQGISENVIGEGTYIFYSPQPNATIASTQTISVSGDSEMEYTVYYELNE